MISQIGDPVEPGHICDVLRRGDYALCRLEPELGDRILRVVPASEATKSGRRLDHEPAGSSSRL